MGSSEEKKCKSKCGNMVKFDLSDQRSNQCEHLKLVTLMEQGKKCYNLDNKRRQCSKDHVVMRTSEVGKKAPHCKEFGETFDERIHGYLVHRLGIEDGTSHRFSKTEQPSIPYDQFFKLVFG